MNTVLTIFLAVVGFVGFFAAVSYLARVDARQLFHGDWRERFQCPHCDAIDQYAWDVCPDCGHQMHPSHIYSGGGEWKTVTCRAVGLSGWEFKDKAA